MLVCVWVWCWWCMFVYVCVLMMYVWCCWYVCECGVDVSLCVCVCVCVWFWWCIFVYVFRVWASGEVHLPGQSVWGPAGEHHHVRGVQTCESLLPPFQRLCHVPWLHSTQTPASPGGFITQLFFSMRLTALLIQSACTCSVHCVNAAQHFRVQPAKSMRPVNNLVTYSPHWTLSFSFSCYLSTCTDVHTHMCNTVIPHSMSVLWQCSGRSGFGIVSNTRSSCDQPLCLLF